jgi:hypothetical protein
LLNALELLTLTELELEDRELELEGRELTAAGWLLARLAELFVTALLVVELLVTELLVTELLITELLLAGNELLAAIVELVCAGLATEELASSTLLELPPVATQADRLKASAAKGNTRPIAIRENVGFAIQSSVTLNPLKNLCCC